MLSEPPPLAASPFTWPGEDVRAKKGQNSPVLQCDWGFCPSWGLFMVSGKISDASGDQDVSKTPLGALPPWLCSDPAWPPWRSGRPIPAAFSYLLLALLVPRAAF